MEHGRGSVRHRAMQPQPSFPDFRKSPPAPILMPKNGSGSILKEANDTPLKKRSLLALLAKPL